ncbi:MAG: thiamine diphosphokinase [Bacillota bacterium]
MHQRDAKRIVIIANGECPEVSVGSGDYVLCLNGGTNRACQAGVLPHAIVGDLDSLGSEAAKVVLSGQVNVLRYPAEKDKTDMELGLEFLCRALRPNLNAGPEVLILGGLGQRLDQTLANLFILERYARKGFRFILRGPGVEARVLGGPQELHFASEPGRIVSLLSLSRTLKGLSIEGLKYEIHDVTLRFGDTRGISNEFMGGKAVIRFESGVLLTVREV